MKLSEQQASLQHEHEQGIVMVCVTRQKTCERLITKGAELADAGGASLHVVHAVRIGENFLGNAFEGEALEYLFTAAQLYNGQLAVLRAEDAEETLTQYAIAHAAKAVVMGKSPEGTPESFEGRMRKRLPLVEVIVV